MNDHLGKITRLLVFLFASGLGLYLAWFGITRWHRDSTARDWPQVVGQYYLVSQRGEEIPHLWLGGRWSQGHWNMERTFVTFTYNGEQWTAPVDLDFSGAKDGDQVSIAVDPSDPLTCCLVGADMRRALIYEFTFAAGLLLFAWWVSRPLFRGLTAKPARLAE